MSIEMLLQMFRSTQPSKSRFELVQDASLDESLAMKKKTAKEKQQVWNRSRSELLGSDHKNNKSLHSVISWILDINISYSGKKAIKVLHCLGHCFMLPGVDYDYMGTFIPASSSYDTVCKWCAKKANISGDMDSSVSNTSVLVEHAERVELIQEFWLVLL